MTDTTFDTVDEIATLVGTGLVLFGVVVLGAVETLAGKPYGAVPLTNDAGEVVATPAVDPTLRTGIVILGLLVLLGWSVYRIVAGEVAAGDRSRTTTTAD